MLIAITVSAIVNLRGLPLMASNGYLTLILSFCAALFFLIPSTYVCAQLSTHFAERGGVYEWVRHAFGQQWGFIAIWMEWINNIIGFPATLATIVGMFFLLTGHTIPSPFVFTFSMLAVLWLALGYNQWPIAFSSWINVLGSVATIFIAMLIIGLGIVWMGSSSVNLSNLHPTTISEWPSQIAIFVGFIGAYSGMQITGFHTQNVMNAKKQYRVVLPIAALIIMVMMLGGSFMMAILIPHDQLNVISGIEQMVQIFFQHFHWTHLGDVVGGCVLISTLASFSAWLIGPARGMQTALAQIGVTHYFVRLNKFSMPSGLLCLQGIITSLLIALFMILPSIKIAFFLLIAITSQFTALMYILVFAAGFKLIAKTSLGKTLCCLGMVSCSIGFIIGTFAPSQLKLISYHEYSFIVIGGDFLIILLGGLFAYKLRKKYSVLPAQE